MRILFVCKSLPDTFKGGIQTHIWELTRELVQQNCEVTILTAGSWRKGLQVTTYKGRDIIHLPYPPGRRVPGLRKTLEDLSFNLVAYRWLRKHAADYDRIHLQGRSGCFYAALRGKSATPLLCTFHRLLEVEYEYDGQRTNFVDGFAHRTIMGAAERSAARRCDQLIAVSQEMKRELVEYVGSELAPTEILPNGVSPDFGNPLIDAARWQLVFVGRLEVIKGVYTLINALPHVDERVQLVLVGDGPERDDLEALVKQLGLSERVRFEGNQDAESVRYTIQRSYALVLPSFHESQGIVLLEAGVCGRPVIAAQSPGIDEVVDHDVNGLMFVAGDAPALAASINQLFLNPELALRLGLVGRQRALTNYDWQHIAARTLEVYQRMKVLQQPSSVAPLVPVF